MQSEKRPDMNHKPVPYDTEEQPLPTAAEATAAYSHTGILGNGILSTFNHPNFTEKKPVGFDEQYGKMKAEADRIYGKDRDMTPEEYFGKLWYVVEGLYEHI